MAYDTALVAGKLRRWEHYLDQYRLPAWREIPDYGLYMEQLILLLKDYLDYLPPELKEEQFITASTINNYVRTNIMPEPVKKRYYRVHIAYIIVILTLKQSLSIALIQKIIPMDLSSEEVERHYTAYAQKHRQAAQYFMEQVRRAAGPILGHEDSEDFATGDTAELIVMSAVCSGFARLMAEKLLLLDGKDLTSGGSIALKGIPK